MSDKKSVCFVLFTILLIAGPLMWVWLHVRPAPTVAPISSYPPTDSSRSNPLELREQQVDKTIWAKEMLAQQCGRTFEILWDSLNAATNKLAPVSVFPVGEVVLGNWDAVQSLPHGIKWYQPAGPGPTLSRPQWRRWIEAFERDGWQLENVEFRHTRFDTDNAGQPWQSHFYFAARLTHPVRTERAMVEGDLPVDWLPKPPGRDPPAIKRIDASHLTFKIRHGEPGFRQILMENITPPNKAPYADPLILYDLDGDGLSEIILVAKNLVYRRQGDGHYRPEPLCRYPITGITTAVIADFDGDGTADLLCAKSEGLFLFPGSPQGTFDTPSQCVWSASSRLRNAMVLTCGDIDHDGDLDVFLAQYKVPTLGAILRPHYYDANDGHAAYLLLNDGHGHFTNVTEAAGLGQKRWRRVYSASLVDLDGDGHLDLVMVSDFAGLDLFRNDGHGHFTEVTQQWVPESHAFGMAHALADFNVDGRLDLLMIGMPSASVDRLEHLNLWRSDVVEDHTMRKRMTYGNRLYLARAQGGFEQTPLNDTIARSGWSWGCSAFDFDNDGFPDVYIANGLQSKQSVREYEPEFWLHDVYINDSVDDVTASDYFLRKFSRTRGAGWSYGGYEKNRLYLNLQGKSFAEIGYLMGVGLEPDTRNVVADDLDGDGKVDLLMATLEVWPEDKQTLRVYQNTLKDSGHWIGFRFREEGRGNSPVGVQVQVTYQGRSTVRHIVTGDSHRSQHSNTVHFGLGNATQVDRAEIRWPNGQTIILYQPAIDHYHTLHAPTGNQ